MLDIEGLTITRVARDDEGAMRELQGLLERCTDYYELHEGEAPRSSAAVDEFDLAPPETARDDIFVFLFRDGEAAIAEMSIVRNCPKEGEWWIGLFVVDPRVRSRGHGRRIIEAASRWLQGQTIVIAVDEENPRGDKFWRSVGFVETGRRDYTAPTTGMLRRVVIMRRRCDTNGRPFTHNSEE